MDLPRARRGAADDIVRSLDRLGLHWDGEVVAQSGRTAAYEAALDALRGQSLVYRCACTRRALAALPLGPLGERVYPGTCRAGVVSREGACAVRVRVPDAPIAFVDRVFGRQEQHLARDVGDFVVRRADGLFAYQLAVVVDDAAQGVSDVVRGADLLASTPRQVFLQRALGLPSPRHLHVPLAVDAMGAKLSKSSGAARLPRAPLAALAAAWNFLGQPAAPEAFANVDDFWQWAIAGWSPSRITPSRALAAPASFDGGARV